MSGHSQPSFSLCRSVEWLRSGCCLRLIDESVPLSNPATKIRALRVSARGHVTVVTAARLTQAYARRMQTNSGFITRATVLLLLIALCPLFASGQSPSGKSATVTTDGKQNPGAVSDINAQLIWLLAASPAAKDSPDEWKVRFLHQVRAFAHGRDADGARPGAKLAPLLREFRSRHDEIAAQYNALIPSVAREDVWVEYRNFRVKINDLVAETVRNLYNTFPESASSFHTAIEQCKQNITLFSYNSSTDPDYATSPRAATTGFTYIQGAVSSGWLTNVEDHKHKEVRSVTVVITGMVPGCPGLVFPNVKIGSVSGAWIEGPKQQTLEYMNFQVTRPLGADEKFWVAVSCEIAKAK